MAPCRSTRAPCENAKFVSRATATIRLKPARIAPKRNAAPAASRARPCPWASGHRAKRNPIPRLSVLACRPVMPTKRWLAASRTARDAVAQSAPGSHIVCEVFTGLSGAPDAAHHDGEDPGIGLDGAQIREVAAANRRQHQAPGAQGVKRIMPGSALVRTDGRSQSRVKPGRACRVVEDTPAIRPTRVPCHASRIAPRRAQRHGRISSTSCPLDSIMN